ncbi:MAG: signal peptide peptidase SppA [Spirobacillus cienkowskii]|jgi:protease-4|uniref:Signal peptide peptidase SppA n=1 Tax=Spirobacillus cienkowskii TaxID=495820 RepID=A0A369KR24_9BACT|nr:MAG: signal peptide peptidase SppA [Spirobacillus cienkowskii]
MSSKFDENQTPSSGRFRTIINFLKTVFATIGAISVTLFILFILTIGFALYSFSSGIKSISSFNKTLSKTGHSFVVPTTNSHYIAGIQLNGEINTTLSSIIIEKLETAKNDKNAIGILLEVNSPGGSVVASQEIYDTIKSINTQKPVVAYVRDMAASGAYYSSASSAKIIANRGSLIGSIGVIMNGFEADKLLQFLKINPVVIKTGSLKDTGSPARPMTEKDKQYLQELIEETRIQFVDDIKSARKTTDSAMKYMSDGRVILAPQALNLKLIDAIGTKSQAATEVATLAKQSITPQVIYYDDLQSFSDFLSLKMANQLSILTKEVLSERYSISKQQSLKIPTAEY